MTRSNTHSNTEARFLGGFVLKLKGIAVDYTVDQLVTCGSLIAKEWGTPAATAKMVDAAKDPG